MCRQNKSIIVIPFRTTPHRHYSPIRVAPRELFIVVRMEGGRTTTVETGSEGEALSTEASTSSMPEPDNSLDISTKRPWPGAGNFYGADRDGEVAADENGRPPMALHSDANIQAEYARIGKLHQEQRLCGEKSCTKTLTPPLAANLDDFIACPEGLHPRPEWYILPVASDPRTEVFGSEQDSAVLYCLKKQADKAALVLLRDFGAPANEADSCGGTPMLLAIHEGAEAVVEYLLSRPDGVSLAFHSRWSDGTGAISIAEQRGHIDILRTLLSNAIGASQLATSFKSVIDARGTNGTTPLMRASYRGQLDVVQCLIQHGADVKLENTCNHTSLAFACSKGQSDIVRYLLEFGKANVNEIDVPGLRELVRLKWVDTVQVLVSHGCELALPQNLVEALRTRSFIFPETVELIHLLSPQNQVTLVQQQKRRELAWTLMRSHSLLQQERALVQLTGSVCFETLRDADDRNGLKLSRAPALEWSLESWPSQSTTSCSIHWAKECLFSRAAESDFENQGQRDSRALTLLRVMTLPFPLARKIAELLPAPLCWDERLKILTRRCSMGPESAVTVTSATQGSLVLTLDLLDEVFEAAGFLQACDEAEIPIWPTLSPFEVRYQHRSDPSAPRSALDLYANNEDLDLSAGVLDLDGLNQLKPVTSQERFYLQIPVGFKTWTSWLNWCRRHCPKFRRYEVCTDKYGSASQIFLKLTATAFADAFGQTQPPVPFIASQVSTSSPSEGRPSRDSMAGVPAFATIARQQKVGPLQRQSPFSIPLVLDLSRPGEYGGSADSGIDGDCGDDGMPILSQMFATPPLPTMIEIRRYVNYPAILDRHWGKLIPVLTRSPYNMPLPLLHGLLECVDDISMVRRLCSAGTGSSEEVLGEVTSPLVGVPTTGLPPGPPLVDCAPMKVEDMIRLVSRFCSWYEESHRK